MATQYLALVHKAPGSRFGVTFPDLPGCVAAGDSASAALASARGALALHIDGMTEDGDPLPPARGMDEILADPACAEEAKCALWAVVPVMSRRGRLVRLNISLDNRTVDLIDAAAEARGLTRSAFLAEAAHRWVEAEGI